jgi:glycine/D-amino acid oxidase-like deaminating enzyme
VTFNLAAFMTISYWLDAHREKQTRQVDVAIIGGGIMGACAAWWLSKRKGLKTALIEANKPGWGAAGRSGGFVLRGIMAYYDQACERYGREQAKWIFQFTEQTQAHMAEFAEQTGNQFQYQRCGSYLLACSLEELHYLERAAAMLVEDGFTAEYLKQDPLKRDYYGAIYNPGDAAVQPALLVEALIAASGVSVLQGEQVFRLEPSSTGGVEIESGGYRIRCDRLLLLTNAYAPLLEQWFAGKLQPVRGQVIVTRPLKKQVLDRICYANFGYEYFRQLPDGRLLLGGCREPFAAEEVTYADNVTPSVQTALIGYLKDRFPEAAGVGIDYRWSGVMAFTRDGLPLVGELIHQPVVTGSLPRSVPGVFYALGCNGHGLGWSFALSKLLVEVALDGADPGLFSASRLNAKAVAAQ